MKKPSIRKNGKEENEEAFLRKFAVEIGAALREREDAAVERQEQRQQQRDIIESMEDLYRSLVFDEPQIGHIHNLPAVASLLSKSLLSSSSNSSYSLSDRLVNGIIYLCNQNPVATTKRRTKENETRNTNDYNDATGHSEIKKIMTKLAFCVLVEIPLECCRDEENFFLEGNMEKIRKLLGSFKGSSMIEENQEKEKSQSTCKGFNSLSDSLQEHDDEFHTTSVEEENNDGISADLDRDDNNNFTAEEVWAMESDSSDFDYDGDEQINSRFIKENWIQSDDDWLDPKFLSEQDHNLTQQQIRDTIGTLLQIASYSLLEPIFCLPKKDTLLFSSKLAQLTLILLKPRKKNGSLPNLPWNDLDTTILSPLWILRDAASYYNHTDISVRKSCSLNYTQTYLGLLQTLLAIDQAYLEDLRYSANSISITNSDVDLCIASIVGMSSLSSWCSAEKKATQLTVDTILDSMNDLSHVVERAGHSYKTNLQHILIPILECLSGIYYDRVNDKKQPDSSVPQTLLNSGFLRQILSLATAVDESTTGSDGAFHYALWGLCIAFPRIVGKYVFRFPGSLGIIRSYKATFDLSEPDNCIHCLLWNIYGWLQCKESSLAGSTNIVWKKKNSSSSNGTNNSLNTSPLTSGECSEVCAKAWSELCDAAKNALEASNGSDDAELEKIISGWGRLFVLLSIPSIATIIKTLVDASPLEDISTILSIQSEVIDSKSDDDKNDKPSRRQRTIAKARKVLKEYKIFFLGSVNATSKID